MAPTALHVSMPSSGDGGPVCYSNGSVDCVPSCNGLNSQHASSVWDSVPPGEPDAILSIIGACAADPHPNKLNLGVGAYRDEDGKPRILDAVRRAELQLVNEIQPDKVVAMFDAPWSTPATCHTQQEYSAASGNQALCTLSAALLFGDEHPLLKRQCIATVQTISGTGALRLAGELLRQVPNRLMLLPDPSWALHRPMFEALGLAVSHYRYYHHPTRALDLEGMLVDLQAAPQGSVVLLHTCAHNPTGVDPTPEEWGRILRVVQQRRLVPLFDVAYQGFASGDMATDAYALRLFGHASVEMLVAQSYAKTMGLYGERVGTLSVVCADAVRAATVGSQLKQLARLLYSNPPRHGAEVAVLVLSQPALRASWEEELASMCARLQNVRKTLLHELTVLQTPGDWSHITAQRGMFSYTGLSAKQVALLRSKWHVYMTEDGRISIAALQTAQCAYLARAMHDVVTTCADK